MIQLREEQLKLVFRSFWANRHGEDARFKRGRRSNQRVKVAARYRWMCRQYVKRLRAAREELR